MDYQHRQYRGKFYLFKAILLAVTSCKKQSHRNVAIVGVGQKRRIRTFHNKKNIIPVKAVFFNKNTDFYLVNKEYLTLQPTECLYQSLAGAVRFRP